MSLPAFRHVLVGSIAAAALAFLLAPTIVVLVQSVADAAYAPFPPDTLSLRWLEAVVSAPRWREALVRSALIATAVSLLSVAIGTPAVYALVRFAPRGGSLVLAALLAPLVLPGIVLGIALFVVSARVGLAGTAVPLLIAHLALALPFVVAVLWSAFARVDWSLEEAAIDLGFSRPAAFVRTVVPQIGPGLAGASAFAWLASFDQLETSLFLSPPGSQTLPVEMFRQLQQMQDPTVAALGAFLVLVLVAAGLMLAASRTGRLGRR